MCFLVLSGASTAADANKDPLIPDADYVKVFESNVTVLKEALKTPNEKGMAVRAKLAAILIAAAAQDDLNGDAAPRRATVRAAALKMAGLIDGKQFEEAEKLASELVGLRADPAAKKEKVKLSDKISIPELMSQFQFSTRGRGYEKGFGPCGSYGQYIRKADDKTVVIAYELALIGDLIIQLPPTKKPQKWLGYSEDMRAAGVDLAAVAGKKDAQAVKGAADKMSAACANCHSDYRK
jgi:hypothetical protein